MTGSTDIRSRLAEVTSAGGCSHPIRLFGETVNMATGELDQRVLKVPCKDRRAVVCPACSYLYKADAWILVASGLNGGKGVPESVALHRRLFITLTAPSFGAVHTDGARNGRCHPGRNLGSCSHGRPRGCARRHESGDLDLGSPLCLECHDYRGAVIWNAMASRLWNRTVTQVRRSVAKSHGLRERDLPKVARLSYLKVAEIQRRGLLHFHAILRVDGPDGPETGPPAWLTTELLAEHVRDAVGWIGVGVGDGTEARWGSQVDIQDVTASSLDDLRIAAYLAKYAAKTTDGSLELARRFKSRAEIDRLRVAEHPRRMALTSWDLASDPGLEHLRLREHAHTFGFAGQLITKSRSYSTTFTSLRAARQAHQAKRSGSDPVLGSFGFVGRGYDDPAAERLAEVVFEQRRELSRELRMSRVMSQEISQGL